MTQVDEQFTEMAVETPTWLNLCFVEKILRKSESDNSIQVIDILSKPASSKGDNYTSDIIRITAEFSCDQGGRKITEKKSILAKISLNIQQDYIAQVGFFHTEISMMSETLDKINELLGPKHRISGRCLYIQNENPKFLILEDLAPLGFRMADRRTGLDLVHTVLALHGLARFHAASVAICEKVDFQLCVYTSPALDLLYFFNTSLSLDVIENKRDIILNEYLCMLSETMKQLNCKTQPPTIEELKATLKRRASYGMIATFAVLPNMLCSKSEATDLDDILSTEFVNPGLKDETYKKLIIRRLPLYDELGLLNVK